MPSCTNKKHIPRINNANVFKAETRTFSDTGGMLKQIEQTNSNPSFITPMATFPDPSTHVNNPTNSLSNPTISSKSLFGFKKELMLDQLIKNYKFKKEIENKKERESERKRVIKRNTQHLKN